MKKEKEVLLSIDKDYLKSLTNLKKSERESKRQDQSNKEFSLFFEIWIAGKRAQKQTKLILAETQEAFKSRGWRCGRTKFLELVDKFHFGPQKREADRQHQEWQKRRITKEEFQKAYQRAKKSKSIVSGTIDEVARIVAQEIKPDLEKFYKEKGDRIRAGRKAGSIKGGEKNKNKFI